MRELKEIVALFVEQSGVRKMSTKQLLVVIYMTASFALCLTCNVVATIVGICNLLNSERLAHKYGLDDFEED